MDKIKLYHGSFHIVDKPICAFGRDNLDFGKGFYLTDIKDQAISWAKRPIPNQETIGPILNIYEFDKSGYLNEAKSSKIFNLYNEEWLHFIVESRTGRCPWREYDYIEGGVANDRVIDTVNLYISGLMDLSTALTRLSMHKPNNQICLLNQKLLDKYLHFIDYEEL